MAQITLDKMSKTYENGFHAVNDLSLEIADGEFLVLVGPSGCGKSTALRMIAGLESISGGEMLIGGRVVNDVPSKDRDIAMVFQSYALYPHLSVRDNIAFPLKLRKTPKEEIKRRVDEASKLLELDEYIDRKPGQLSGGQRQRVAMGRAIVRQPQAFLMDEPLSNLDAKLRVQMRSEIAKLQRSLKVTTVYVTHDQVEAMTMGDRIAVFHNGIVEQLGPPMQLYDRPANEFVAGFIGAPRINLVDRPALDAPLPHRALWDSLAADAEASVRRVGLRPEHLHVVDAGQGVPANVELAEHLGDVSILHLRVSGVDDLLSAKVGAGHARVAAGQIVGLMPDKAWALSFGADARLAA